jgi:tetratricopeptide (TPR) repeat protein
LSHHWQDDAVSESVSESQNSYRKVPDPERNKAKVFFDRAAAVAATGNYEYGIEMYLQGLNIDPEEVEAHKKLREVSLMRKASGGKPLGMLEAMKLRRPSKDDKANMLNFEKLLSYDPSNTDHMLGMMQNAHRAGCYETVMWIGPIMLTAVRGEKRPDVNKFTVAKDIYKDLGEYRSAIEACHLAAMLRTDDMDLQTELKHLAAKLTIAEGQYSGEGSFQKSLRNADQQQKLMESEKDFHTQDVMERMLAEAEAEWKAQPEEPGKIGRYVEALVKSEDPELENKAIDVLQQAFDRSKQFRFRLTIGQIKMRQLARYEKSLEAAYLQNKADAKLKQELLDFRRERAENELAEYQLAAEAYPTDLRFRYEMAVRFFKLGRYDEAIPVFQQARNDPKFRTEATILLGRAFLDAGFVEEAVDTLKGMIDDYQIRGDEKSMLMTYWYGRALEAKGDPQAALKSYSQVAQWDFNYADVQLRIKALRTKAAT